MLKFLTSLLGLNCSIIQWPYDYVDGWSLSYGLHYGKINHWKPGFFFFSPDGFHIMVNIIWNQID